VKTEIADVNGENVKGWVGYDADCPFCRAVERRWHPILRRRGFPFVPLQDPAFAARLGVSPDHPHAEMKLLLAEGRVLGGSGAWTYLMQQIGWLAPLGWLAESFLFRPLTAAAYRWVAANRYCLGDVCGLPPKHRGRLHHTTAFFESP
jgi:predicted DCC family thiol-disulfide oxidoreductase YuxK